MATLHLVSGPIGAGKTTKASEIVQHTNAFLMSPDRWMNVSGIPLRNSEARAAIEEAQWKISALLLSQGYDVVIEWGTWGRAERLDILSKANALGHTMNGYFLTPELSVLMSRVASREANWEESDRVTSHEIIESAKSFENPQSSELSQYAEIWFSDSDSA